MKKVPTISLGYMYNNIIFVENLYDEIGGDMILSFRHHGPLMVAQDLLLQGILSEKQVDEMYSLSQEPVYNLEYVLTDYIFDRIAKRPNTYKKLKQFFRFRPSMKHIYLKMVKFGEKNTY